MKKILTLIILHGLALPSFAFGLRDSSAAKEFEAAHKSVYNMLALSPAAGRLNLEFQEGKVSVMEAGNLANIFEEVAKYGVVPTQRFNPFEDVSVVKCFETAEVKGAFFCVFNSQKMMNEILIRANYFCEEYKGEYISKENFFSYAPFERGDINREGIEINRGNAPGSTGVRGFDLQGEDLNKFLELSARDSTLPEADEKMSFYFTMETEFLRFIRALQEKHGGNYTLITTLTTDDFYTISSHEFMHAQYFRNPQFAANVDSYIYSIEDTAPFKLFVKFGKMLAYPNIEEDKTLRHNEFMAFMLSHGMYEDSYKKWIPFASVMRRLLIQPGEIDAASQNFFDEVYKLWAENDWGETGNFAQLRKTSLDIRDKYGLSDPPDATKSPFYKYLEERGTPPLIITP